MGLPANDVPARNFILRIFGDLNKKDLVKRIRHPELLGEGSYENTSHSEGVARKNPAFLSKLRLCNGNLKLRVQSEVQDDLKGNIKHCAFTMAEVLITIGIMGVVIAMTLPSIINKTQKKILATQLKTTYTILANALEQATVYNEDYKYWTFKTDDLSVGDSSYNFVKMYLAPYLKNTNIVRQRALLYCNNVTYKYIDGSIADCNSVLGFCNTCGSASGGSDTDSNMTQLYLSNGAIVVVLVRYGETDTSYGTAEFHVDVNGYKGPNVWGKDVFRIPLADNPKGRYRLGEAINTREFILKNHCTKQEAYDCAAVIMMDNWEIKDDYPW